MTTLVLEHLQHADSASPDITIDSSGRVGIGTTTPNSKLHIEGGMSHNKLSITTTANGSTGYDASIDLLSSANNSEVSINMGSNSDPDREQIKTYQSDMFFTTNAAERMRIHSEGYTELKSSDAYNQLVLTPSGTNAPASINFNTPGTGRAKIKVQDAEFISILSTGNVGIGTANPAEKLEVNGSFKVGNLKIQNVNGGRIGFNRNTADGAIYDSGFAAFQINGAYTNADFMAFEAYTSGGVGTDAMAIRDNGNVGIGTTSPQKKLEVRTGNGELSHFGSNSANAVDNYTGISLGYAENGNSAYRKVGIVSVGRGDGAARQDLAFLVDSNADGGSAQLVDTKMRISHEGYVTTPDQPAWSAGLNGSQSGLITNYSVHLNNGNHFSNGVFTCPVAGNYFISFFGMTSSAGTMDVELRINGSTRNELVPYSSSAGFHTSAGGTTVIYLNANDTIQMHNNNTQLYGNATGRHTGFSGYLIG